jgi:mannose/cellobiose epimerase-like protein (N-acyl-D-glucosamine 2-epimerase family)/anti-anti-sigma regulatory factor
MRWPHADARSGQEGIVVATPAKTTNTFSFSDLIAGYVVESNASKGTFSLKTTDGRVFPCVITPAAYAEIVRNLGEGFIDATGAARDMLTPGRYVYAYGIFYPEADGLTLEVKHLVFLDRDASAYRFEEKDWWVKQIREIGDFYLRAQFPDGVYDFNEYRTRVTADGRKEGDLRQETDTISRLIYGMASAYMLTGEERFLEAAENGTKYLRDHFRYLDESEGIVYWYHAIDRNGPRERKIFASEFGDDYNAIPAYEQIYALAGPIQTYRVSGDPAILRDAEMTIRLFDRHYLDTKRGGYYSHLDPVTLDPHVESLGQNRAKKNWNSVGDHAPAYLINLVLATGNKGYAKMLTYTADTIADHFQDYENSPYVNEKFNDDWSHDLHWGWQQNRGVVGHNLKIAWNLTRIANWKASAKWTAFAKKIAEEMPKVGMDMQRGGWYDVMERNVAQGETYHRHVWHDRKAWWQQEQGILAYMIMAGVHNDAEYLRLMRESTAFYNAWFLDHDEGAVYFNVLANGLPYMLGTERLKGSHSMSFYHSSELCYLSQVYTNLLITHEPLDLYFKPIPGGLPGNVLRVSPDMLPAGSIKIDEVFVDGKPYSNFDADGLTVIVPQTTHRPSIRVRIVPVVKAGRTLVTASLIDNEAHISLSGKGDERGLVTFESELHTALGSGNATKIVLDVAGLDAIPSSYLRALVFSTHVLSPDTEIVLKGANDAIRKAFANADIEVTLA